MIWQKNKNKNKTKWEEKPDTFITQTFIFKKTLERLVCFAEIRIFREILQLFLSSIYKYTFLMAGQNLLNKFWNLELSSQGYFEYLENEDSNKMSTTGNSNTTFN